MVALLAIAVVYMVIVANQVSSGKEQIAELGTQIVTAERSAAALKPYADFAQVTVARREAVKTVAGARFGWDRTLQQLSRVAPGDVWLTSAKGTLTPTSTVKGGSSGSSTLRAALPGPALELSGCGKREQRRAEVHGPALLDVRRQRGRLQQHEEVERLGQQRRGLRLRRPCGRDGVLARDVLQAERGPRRRGSSRSRTGRQRGARPHPGSPGELRPRNQTAATGKEGTK